MSIGRRAALPPLRGHRQYIMTLLIPYLGNFFAKDLFLFSKYVIYVVLTEIDGGWACRYMMKTKGDSADDRVVT